MLAAGTLLAMLVLGACESAEDQEIRRLIEEIASLQEQTIAVMEATAEKRIAELRESGSESVTSFEGMWEREVETTRERHEATLTKLREAQVSGDWEIAYPEQMAMLNGSALAVVGRLRDLAEETVRSAEKRRAARSLEEQMQELLEAGRNRAEGRTR